MGATVVVDAPGRAPSVGVAPGPSGAPAPPDGPFPFGPGPGPPPGLPPPGRGAVVVVVVVDGGGSGQTALKDTKPGAAPVPHRQASTLPSVTLVEPAPIEEYVYPPAPGPARAGPPGAARRSGSGAPGRDLVHHIARRTDGGCTVILDHFRGGATGTAVS